MDHDEAREQLELAAVEPGGLERLMAGDTPIAQAVAGHLAGCESCTTEVGRLRRSSDVIRSGLREMPPPDLRERTLAAIRAEGVRRPRATAVAVMSPRTTTGRGRTVLPMIATIAAAVVLSVVTTSLVVGSRVDDQLAAQEHAIGGLEKVTVMSMDVSAEPDAAHVELASAGDPSVSGSLVFSPSTTDVVVTATGLDEPAPGYEYRCWVEIGGTRQRIGRMSFGNDLAYWGGPVPVVAGVSSGAVFGISLVQVSATSLDAAPVLVGSE
jgi:hypothetical protein